MSPWVAHFEPIRIPITGEGIYGCVAMSLPRAMSDEYAVYVEEARILLLTVRVSQPEPAADVPRLTACPSPTRCSTFVPEDTKGATLGKVTGTIVGGTLKKTGAGTQLRSASGSSLHRSQPLPQQGSLQLVQAAWARRSWMKPRTYKEDDEEDPDLDDGYHGHRRGRGD